MEPGVGTHKLHAAHGGSVWADWGDLNLLWALIVFLKMAG